MTKIISRSRNFLLIVPLSACLSPETGSDVDVGGSPTNISTGDAEAYEFIYQPTGGSPDRVIRALPSAGWYYYPDTLVGVPADFSVFLQSSEGYLLRSETESGSGEVIIVDNGSQLTRSGDTILPYRGTASYSGTYGAIVVDGVRDMNPETVSGSVTLEVDFSNQWVSGSITDRIFDSATNASNVEFVGTDLTSGTFSGVTTGGDLNSGGLLASNGTYTGLIVGPNGEEVIGSVTIVHNGTGTFTEQGGFILNQ